MHRRATDLGRTAAARYLECQQNSYQHCMTKSRWFNLEVKISEES